MVSKAMEGVRETKGSRQQAPRGKAATKAAAPKPPPARAQQPQAAPDAAEDPEEVLLRGFDLATAYGPCTGMTRLQRWERAEKFGLAPPQGVREVLLKHGPEHPKNQNLWAGRV